MSRLHPGWGGVLGVGGRREIGRGLLPRRGLGIFDGHRFGPFVVEGDIGAGVRAEAPLLLSQMVKVFVDGSRYDWRPWQ